MVEDDEYCVDVVMQISAATETVHKAGEWAAEEHLKCRVGDAIEQSDDACRDDKCQELVAIFLLSVK